MKGILNMANVNSTFHAKIFLTTGGTGCFSSVVLKYFLATDIRGIYNSRNIEN